MNNEKIIFSVLLLVLMFASTYQVHAQEKKNQIKTSLVVPLAGAFQLSYERMLNYEMSLELGICFGELVFVNSQYRYYLSENMTAPSGVFISPFLLLSNQMFGGGLTVGYQRLFKQKVSLEAFLGPLISDENTAWGGVSVGLAF